MFHHVYLFVKLKSICVMFIKEPSQLLDIWWNLAKDKSQNYPRECAIWLSNGRRNLNSWCIGAGSQKRYSKCRSSDKVAYVKSQEKRDGCWDKLKVMAKNFPNLINYIHLRFKKLSKFNQDKLKINCTLKHN